MAEKKRKRHEDRDAPRKRVSLDNSSPTIKVSMIQDEPWAPILASAPGLVLPTNLALRPYTRSQTNRPRSSMSDPDLLLHSSSHPKLDYTAREESSNGSENYINHFVGVYDPDTETLQLVKTRSTVVRSTLRKSESERAQKEKSQPDTMNYLSARSTLGLAFGTKKSQKAIRNLTANAIKPSPSKSDSQGSPERRNQLDPLASAVVSSMAESSSTMRTREELQAEIDDAKPIPKPNMQASTPAEVYPIEQLVGGANTLAAMGVKDWIDKVNAGQDVQLRSRYVARKLIVTVKSGDVKKLKVMRYLLLLIEWFASMKTGAKSIKKVPKIEELGSLVEAYGSETVKNVARRFADGFQLNKWYNDNLITHILALAITLDNFTIDTHDIREDLKLEIREVDKYFHELGCSIALPSEAEQNALKISKAEGRNHRIAKLRIPLTFPKMRTAISAKKRK